MSHKTLRDGAFAELDANRKRAVVLLFEDEKTDEQIAKEVNRSRTTLAKWKKDKKFQEAEREYRSLAIDSYVPDAIKEIHRLSTKAKSEMVRLQSSTTILNMAGYSANGDSPEKTKQEVRKLKADADLAELKVKQESSTGGDGLTVNIIKHGGVDDADS
ncbi:phBC6A51 family helix-turn-helix protein [Ligilactobacillus salitolerans]|uniref:phBC6A51 family helix-turn-helix protein n=1 Tax=Ligilactobacillus salitolerans TaxID=1808352 RepID=UPI000F615E4F|nr:phBC6A51 family helix-turn-helix protein [Ligilactobacillus salitolerans]